MVKAKIILQDTDTMIKSTFEVIDPEISIATGEYESPFWPHSYNVGGLRETIRLSGKILDKSQITEYDHMYSIMPRHSGKTAWMRQAAAIMSGALCDTEREGKKYMSKVSKIPDIKKVIFNDPATIVLFKDGTKTVVKCDGEAFDKEKGLAMAIAKRAMGNNYDYYGVFKKYCKEDKKEDKKAKEVKK